MGTVLPEIPSHETKSNLASLLTLSIFEPHLGQTPNFKQMLLSSVQSSTQRLDALAVAVCEILYVI